MSLHEIHERLRQTNWLTIFALICVAVATGFIMYMSNKLTNTLASPDWCARAIKAEQLSGARSSSSCTDLLKIQVKSLAIDNHIYALTIAVCLAVLVVVVIAKARLDLQASKDSVKLAMESGVVPPKTVAAAAEGAAAGAVAGAATVAKNNDDAGTAKP